MKLANKITKVFLFVCALAFIQHMAQEEMQDEKKRSDFNKCINNTSQSFTECDSCARLIYGE